MYKWIDNLSLAQLKLLIFSSYFYLKEILLIALIALFSLLLLSIIAKIIRLIRHLREPFLFLEITPPVNSKVPIAATAQLYSQIMALMEQKSWYDKLLLRDYTLSLEIISEKNNGIRFLIRAPKSLYSNLEKMLRSYLPGSMLKKSTDYANNLKNPKILEFRQSRHFSLPLASHEDLKNHDPLNYLTGNLNRLASKEKIAVQVTLKPLAHSNNFFAKKETSRIKSSLSRNKTIEWADNFLVQHYSNLFIKLIEGITRIVMIPFFFAAEFITGDMPVFNSFTNKSVPTPKDQEYSVLANNKLSQPLFSTGLRVLIDSNNTADYQTGIKSTFSSFSHSTGQSLHINSNFLGSIIQPIRRWRFVNRMEGGLVLNTTEIATLYHFPHADEAYSEDMKKIKSRELPTPLSLKNSGGKLDVVLGKNEFGGEHIPLGLTLDQRRKHTYVIGKTGTGKTTMLISSIYQDMKNGKGLAVLDPHGDMFKELMGIVPKERIKDVVVFNPSDRAYPIGLNILKPGIHFDNKEDEEEWITSSVLAVFAKITAKEYWGPRMEHILRNTTLTALQTDNPSLFTIQRLLTDKNYQKKIASVLDDPVLKQFWNKEIALLGKMQLSSAVAPLTQRLGSFITSKMSRHILLQPESTISISKIINEGKILLVNLSKGDIGEDHSFFFGAALTSLIWMAAYQRINIPEAKRKDFFLYVDEFQNFATPRFSEITSEGRKFRIGLIASHQNIAQVDDKNILKIIAGNANNLICLKASPDEEKFILPFMEPEVSKGDIVNQPPYHFYMKVDNESSENAFSGETILPSVKHSQETMESVVEASRTTYGKPRAEVEQYLDNLLNNKQVRREKRDYTDNSLFSTHRKKSI